MTLHNIVKNIQKTIESGESSPSAKDMDDFLDEVREAVTGLFEERRDSEKEKEESTLRSWQKEQTVMVQGTYEKCREFFAL